MNLIVVALANSG